MDHQRHQPLALAPGLLFFQLWWAELPDTWNLWWFLKQGCRSSSDLNACSWCGCFDGVRAEVISRRISTLTHSDTLNSFLKAEVYQQESHFPLQLLTVCSVTRGLNEVFMPMGKNTLVCIKHSTNHGLKTPQTEDNRISTSAQAPHLLDGSGLQVGLFCPMFCVWVSPRRPEWEPYAGLAACHHHYLSRCALPSFVFGLPR